jgi:rhodanese-related sulfurtransferase
MDRRTVIVALLAGGCSGNDRQPKTLSAEELAKLLEKRENLFFLDVREPSEIQASGSIKGYVNIPIGQLERRLAEVPRDKLIITA